MAEKRRGLGRGLGALIPSAPSGDARPVDVFFPGAPAQAAAEAERAAASSGNGEKPTQTWRLSTQTVVQEGAASPSAWPALDDQEAGSEEAAHDDGSPLEVTAGTPADSDRVDVADGAQGLLPVPGVRFAEVPLDSIRPNPRQPRTVFDADALAELVSSITEVGVLQPVVVRPLIGADVHDGVAFELIMGERRWRATRAAGLDTIPAIIRETDDADLLRDALLENLHRSELNALEEAAAYQQLLDDFGCTHEELARRIHKSRPQISNTLRLLKLPPLVQRRVAAGVLSAGHARALLGLPDTGAIERLAQRIVAEGLSVRATEEVVAVGGDAERPAPRRRPRAGDRNVALDDLATRLSDRFETRVKIALGKSKGRLTVEFASVQDLNRILATLSPDDPGLLR